MSGIIGTESAILPPTAWYQLAGGEPVQPGLQAGILREKVESITGTPGHVLVPRDVYSRRGIAGALSKRCNLTKLSQVVCKSGEFRRAETLRLAFGASLLRTRGTQLE